MRGGYIELGKLLTVQGKIALAKKAYRNAITTNPKNTDAVFRLIWLSKEDIYQESVKNLTEELEKTIEIDPHDTATINNYYLLGCYLAKCYHEYIKGEKIFKKLVAIDRNNCMGYIMLGVCYAGRGQYELAEDTLKKAQVPDCNARAFTELVVMYHEMGRYQLAEQYASKARELSPADYLKKEYVASLRYIKSRM